MKTLKLFLVDKRNIKCLGFVAINLHEFLRKTVLQEEKHILSDFSRAFSIFKMPTAIENKKSSTEIGKIDIEVCSEFGGYYANFIPKQVSSKNEKKHEKVENEREMLSLPQLSNVDSGKNAKEIKKTQNFEDYRKTSVDLSQLINHTEKLIDEIDWEVSANTKNDNFQHKLAKLEKDLEEKKEKKITKDLPVELELEMLRIQKNLLKSAQSPSNASSFNTQKINEMFIKTIPSKIFLRISLDYLEVDFPEYQKPLFDHISFIKTTLTDNKENLIETYKLN